MENSSNTEQLKKFLKKISIEIETGCWIWQGSILKPKKKQPFAYGHYNYTENGKLYRVFAHRYAYTILKEELGKKTMLWNTCGNTICANPDHWEIAYSENAECSTSHRASVKSAIAIQIDTGKVIFSCPECKKVLAIKNAKKGWSNQDD
jgi:predicted RNA-binding Zn-ribbon protein involved in translation (DUF1610 family)